MLGGLEQAVLLAIVRLRGTAYGKTIHDEVQGRLDRKIARGAVAVVLDRLEEKGFVSSELADPTPVSS
jgi:PadR family transcriptional regulator PadR